MLEGCGGPERTEFSILGGCGDPGQGVVVLKDLIFNSFYLWAGCGGLETSDF